MITFQYKQHLQFDGIFSECFLRVCIFWLQDHYTTNFIVLSFTLQKSWVENTAGILSKVECQKKNWNLRRMSCTYIFSNPSFQSTSMDNIVCKHDESTSSELIEAYPKSYFCNIGIYFISTLIITEISLIPCHLLDQYLDYFWNFYISGWYLYF